MKHLPLKLGIGVVLLFAVVIVACLLWKPLKLKYYRSKMESDEPAAKLNALKTLVTMGKEGAEAVDNYLRGKNTKWFMEEFRDNNVSVMLAIVAGKHLHVEIFLKKNDLEKIIISMDPDGKYMSAALKAR